MWPRVSDPRVFTTLLAGLIGLTWLSLLAWGSSPYARFLSHEEVGAVEGFGGGYVTVVALFVAAWTLMTIAMMLPTSLPLVALFHSFVRRRPTQVRLVLLLITGYLSVWTLFGAGVHLGDRGVHEAVERLGWLDDNAWAIATGTILLAGVYQFTPLKYHCLDKCRSPFGFIQQHWRGGREGVDAFRLGVHHGIFCLGCCWSLMLLMFAVGVGNLVWMLVLGAVMAVEKNAPWGRKLSAPLGALLLVWGVVLVATETSIAGGV
jgi:predicted metal-binding membrane protein